MRKSISVFVLLIILLSMALPAYAMVPMEEILPLGSTCKHLVHIRQGVNTTQYVYENEAVHLKQEVFKAVCAECGKDPQTIIDSQAVENHNWVLKFSDCDDATGLHKYIYECACKTKEFTIRCTGIHEDSMQNVEIPDVDECGIGNGGFLREAAHFVLRKCRRGAFWFVVPLHKSAFSAIIDRKYEKGSAADEIPGGMPRRAGCGGS